MEDHQYSVDQRIVEGLEAHKSGLISSNGGYCHCSIESSQPLCDASNNCQGNSTVDIAEHDTSVNFTKESGKIKSHQLNNEISEVFPLSGQRKDRLSPSFLGDGFVIVHDTSLTRLSTSHTNGNNESGMMEGGGMWNVMYNRSLSMSDTALNYLPSTTFHHTPSERKRGRRSRRRLGSTQSGPEFFYPETFENDVREMDDATVTIIMPTEEVESHCSSPNFSLWNTSRREKLILFCLFVIDVTSQMCLSIMAPFFPQEAETKGVTVSVSGWIFGIFSIVQVVSSPIFGKLIPIMGCRFLITAGQFFAGGCVILFGILDLIEPAQSDIFLALCFVLRIALAIGCTASGTASFAVTAVCFPDNVSTVFGLLETASGLGMMLGPAVGGFLNEAGGFMLSFAVLGGLMLLTVPINLCCIPADDSFGPRSHSVSLWRIISIPAIIVVSLAVIMAALLWSIMDPTLSVQLDEEFQLSSAMMGLLFLLMSGVYAVFSPIWGWMADRLDDSLPMMFAGFIFSAVGLMLLGPSPLLLFITDDMLWINIIALIILGIAVSLALVPTFDKILCAVEKAGCKDDFAVYSYVAGIWGACFAFGEFLGPALGGYGLEISGFAWTMTYTAAGCVVMAVIILLLIIYERRSNRVKREDCSDSILDASASNEEPCPSEITPLLNH